LDLPTLLRTHDLYLGISCQKWDSRRDNTHIRQAAYHNSDRGPPALGMDSKIPAEIREKTRKNSPLSTIRRFLKTTWCHCLLDRSPHPFLQNVLHDLPTDPPTIQANPISPARFVQHAVRKHDDRRPSGVIPEAAGRRLIHSIGARSTRSKAATAARTCRWWIGACRGRRERGC
jgi:hypothetical protein